mgnify:CR=1 FL=1
MLGLIAGAVVSFSAVMLLSLLPIFDLDDEEEAVTATPPPSSESTAETADSGIAGPGRGVGGPPEGRGPGSGGMGTADPLAYGTASPVVMEAFEAGAQRVLLDNFERDWMLQAVEAYKGRIGLEASGGIELETIRDVDANLGTDFLDFDGDFFAEVVDEVTEEGAEGESKE